MSNYNFSPVSNNKFSFSRCNKITSFYLHFDSDDRIDTLFEFGLMEGVTFHKNEFGDMVGYANKNENKKFSKKIYSGCNSKKYNFSSNEAGDASDRLCTTDDHNSVV